MTRAEDRCELLSPAADFINLHVQGMQAPVSICWRASLHSGTHFCSAHPNR
jgi:hypothetical protein